MERFVAPPSPDTKELRAKAVIKKEILSLKKKGKSRTAEERDRLIDLLIEVALFS